MGGSIFNQYSHARKKTRGTRLPEIARNQIFRPATFRKNDLAPLSACRYYYLLYTTSAMFTTGREYIRARQSQRHSSHDMYDNNIIIFFCFRSKSRSFIVAHIYIIYSTIVLLYIIIIIRCRVIIYYTVHLRVYTGTTQTDTNRPRGRKKIIMII